MNSARGTESQDGRTNHALSSPMKKLSLMMAALALAGCAGTSGPDCRDETRSLSTSAKLVSVEAEALPADTGTAQLSLHEGRDFVSKVTAYRDIMWFAGSGMDRNSVTAVHIHEQGSDRLLFDVPLAAASGSPYVIANVFTRQPYAGATDFAELYELVGNERAYVDVHTTDHPLGELRGTLRVENSSWRTFTHAFCS